MKLRIKISLALVVLAIAMIAIAAIRDDKIGINDIFINLGSELLGIVITILFIEYLFEMKEDGENVKQIAWDILHELDYTIWVWQGGEKRFNFDELTNIVSQIKPTDPIAVCTKNCLTRLGYKSENTLRTKKELLEKTDFLAMRFAIQELAKLNETPKYNPINSENHVFVNTTIIAPITHAISHLNNFLKLRENFSTIEIIAEQNCEIKKQEERYFGE